MKSDFQRNRLSAIVEPVRRPLRNFDGDRGRRLRPLEPDFQRNRMAAIVESAHFVTLRAMCMKMEVTVGYGYILWSQIPRATGCLPLWSLCNDHFVLLMESKLQRNRLSAIVESTQRPFRNFACHVLLISEPLSGILHEHVETTETLSIAFLLRDSRSPSHQNVKRIFGASILSSRL